MKYCRNLIPFLVFTCVLLLAASDACFGEGATITEEQWQHVISDEAFGYANEKEAAKKEPNDANALTNAIFALTSFFNTPVGEVLLWALFFGLLAWVLFKIFSNEGLFAPKSEKQTEDEPVVPSHETDLLLIDWERRMQQAISSGDMVMAIKYSYLHLLKLLQQKEQISFRSDKTNHEYYKELKDLSYRKPFRQLTSRYEYIWYGKYPLSKQQYSEYMSTFDALKTRLAVS